MINNQMRFQLVKQEVEEDLRGKYDGPCSDQPAFHHAAAHNTAQQVKKGSGGYAYVPRKVFVELTTVGLDGHVLLGHHVRPRADGYQRYHFFRELVLAYLEQPNQQYDGQCEE